MHKCIIIPLTQQTLVSIPYSSGLSFLQKGNHETTTNLTAL